MKFHLERLEGRNRFTGHGPGYVEVNGERLTVSVVVGEDFLHRGWAAPSLERLGPDSIAPLLDRRPELVLLGTGAAFRFPPRDLLGPLHEAGVGVEVMDTPAACRTFNILLAEGRRVLAAVIVD